MKKSAIAATSTTNFYESYKPFPSIPAIKTAAIRKELLQCIEIPDGYDQTRLVESVRIHILTPVLRSQERRKIGKMRMFEPLKPPEVPRQRRSMNNKVQEQPPTCLKDPSELGRIIVSQKKLQRNAKLSGLHIVSANFKTALKNNLLVHLSSFGPNKGLKETEKKKETLLNATLVDEETQKKEKMRKALRHMNDLAVKRKAVLKGTQTGSPVSCSPPSSEEKEHKHVTIIQHETKEETVVKERQQMRLLPVPKPISPIRKSSDQSEQSGLGEKKRNRRNTVIGTKGMNNFAAALELIALAPINK